MHIPPLQLGASPLRSEQVQQLNALLTSLEPVQAAWLCGYLAGVNQMQAAGAGLTAPMTAPMTVPVAAATTTTHAPVTVMYGSQTGNSEGIAGKLVAALTDRGVAAELKDMGSYKPQQLKQEETLCVVVSTHGEGDPPDTAMELHAFLHGKRAPKLENTSFAVLSLGDTSYEHFCKTGRDFDERLAALGGTRLLDRVDCDVDYEDKAEAWIVALAEKIAAGRTQAVAAAPVFTPGLPLAAPTVSAFDKKNPFPATLLDRINLNGKGSAKETLHLELLLEGSGLTYEPGDALGVAPVNEATYVDELIQRLGADPEVEVAGPKGKGPLRNVLLRDCEVTTITRPFLRGYAELAESKTLNALLADNEQLNTWLYGREILDVLQTWPLPGLAPEEFVELLRKLPPRLYSIASCLDAHPDEVHLCVGVTRYDAHGRRRHGVCSTYLADRVGIDDTVPVYVDVNKNFKLPASLDTPVIMIGPGTGIAPFRAFVEARELQGGGKNWLFFGDQHFDTDFLYQIEWQQWLKQGVLSRMDVAFSRDQRDKLYVQHRMQEKAADLWAWLQEGAHLYVCGDEKRMAHDVHATLLDIARTQGGLSTEDADAYVKQLQKDRRYQRDVY